MVIFIKHRWLFPRYRSITFNSTRMKCWGATGFNIFKIITFVKELIMGACIYLVFLFVILNFKLIINNDLIGTDMFVCINSTGMKSHLKSVLVCYLQITMLNILLVWLNRKPARRIMDVSEHFTNIYNNRI